MTMLVRLKPYNERKGHKTRVYMIGGERFVQSRNWYEVPDDFAAKLKDLHQDHYDEDSADLFDVVTQEEADKIDAKEAEALVNAKATARQPQKLRNRARVPQVTNNAGSIDSVSGDLTSAELNAPTLDAEPEAEPDAEEFTSDVGRVGEGPKARRRR